MAQHRTISAIIVVWALLVTVTSSWGASGQGIAPPLDLEKLRQELSLVRGTAKPAASWPRQIRYPFRVYDFKTDRLRQETRTFLVSRKPVRIIPHAVGVAEILWSICPRERLVAFNDMAADPENSFIASGVRGKGNVFTSKQTEMVIGHRPDLVFTVFYSNDDFKEKLRQARIPSFDLGYFGTIESVKEQILLLGDIIGEEGNARALVRLVDARMRQLKARIPARAHGVRVLYYDEGGYVPGISSNFTSICSMIGAVNVGAEQGVKSWSRIDHETLLKWNPDVIIVPDRGKLREALMSNRMLSHARAIKNGAVYEVSGLYLRATSHYMLLSADLLAGILYRRPR